MKASITLVASTLALAACGADDHEIHQRVAWQVTTSSAGTRAAIEGDELVLEAGGPGPEFWPAIVEASLQVGTELPAGDFEVRFAGVSLADTTALVGVFVAADSNFAASAFDRNAEGWATVHAMVETPEAYDGAHSQFQAGEDAEAELFLSRVGEEVEIRTTSDDYEVVNTIALGSGPVALTVFLQPSPGTAADQSTRATIDRREMDDNRGPFDLDVITE